MEINPLTEQEIQQLRAETKGTAEKIHFNNAGASLPPDVVVDTVINYLKEEALIGDTRWNINTRNNWVIPIPLSPA
jgi:cysteine desulfurase/selenocysteine lyase